MSKKKAPKQQVGKINPEKYIREKSGKLPLYKCWVNENWEKCHIAHIFIARKHANGNLTVCTYFVDLACRGVINSISIFNISIDEINKYLKPQPDIIEISYELAHNIIYAAIEYAEELEIYPHENFTKTTSLFLEEDNDNIPLIAIKCGGKDGKPLYISSETDSERFKKQMIKHLEKKVGRGNFNYILAPQMIDEYEEEEEYEEEVDEEEEVNDDLVADTIAEIIEMEETEQILLFIDLVGKNATVDISQIEYIKIQTLVEQLTVNFVQPEDIDKELAVLRNDLDYPVVSASEFPDSLFTGIATDDSQRIIKLFRNTADNFFAMNQIEESLKRLKKGINQDVPLIHYFELLLSDINKAFDYERSEKLHLQYPDYFLIELLRLMYLYQKDEDKLAERSLALDKMRKLLSGSKKSISDYEYTMFMIIYLPYYLHEFNDTLNNFRRAMAINKYLDNCNSLVRGMLNPLLGMLFKMKSKLLFMLIFEEMEIALEKKKKNEAKKDEIQ
ncbi:MAG: hypothetical protein LBT50_06695 [Prevotellaceae bacterium]|jgi:hypothetical protein|nr:hypothetical protein [Prevotellaceae bacterium]